MNSSQLEKKLEALLRALPRTRPKGDLEHYVGNNQSSLEFLGLSVPQVRGLWKEVARLDPTPSQIREIYLSTNIYELRSLLLNHLEILKKKLSPKEFFQNTKPLVHSIDNWAHSDTLSEFYSYCLEKDAALVLPHLKRWNKSKKEWLIRQSMVSLLYYSSKRKKTLPFSQLIAHIKPHLDSKHKFVQKGVGWTLREIRNVFERQADNFLETNIHRLKSYAFSASTEKMSKQKKAKLLALRRASKQRAKSSSA